MCASFKSLRDSISSRYLEIKSDLKDETIDKAAYKKEDGTIVSGKNHPKILLSLGLKVPEDRSSDSYGFLTNKGRFVSRSEAAVIAGVKNTIVDGQLYTEDLTAARTQDVS